MNCSQTDLWLIVFLIVVGVVGQMVGVWPTARGVQLTRKKLTTIRQVAPVVVQQHGGQSGVFGIGEDPETRMVEGTVNRVVEDINGAVADINRAVEEITDRVIKLSAGTLELQPLSVVLIAVGMVVTLAGSLLWLYAPIHCSGALPI
jgi:hypothetical protein